MAPIISEDVRKRIVQFYEVEGYRNKSMTAHHFNKLGISKTTMYRLLKMYEETGNMNIGKPSGRPAKIMKPKNITRVQKLFTNDPNISVRVAASRLKVSKSSVSEIKVHKLGIRGYTRKPAPLYKKDQVTRVKKNSRKIYNKLASKKGGKILVLDDETYFTADPSQIAGRLFYHSSSKLDTSVEVKIKPRKKFHEKYLVWQAIDEFGNRSEPFIKSSTIDSETYLRECIQKRLIPFIKKHHNPKDVLFWPDLASIHYVTKVMKVLKSKNIEIVDKKENPPNVPQARPIEKYWGGLKTLYSKRKNKPKNLKGFRQVFKNLCKSFPNTTVQLLMKEAKKNLRKIYQKGVYYTYN